MRILLHPVAFDSKHQSDFRNILNIPRINPSWKCVESGPGSKSKETNMDQTVCPGISDISVNSIVCNDWTSFSQ